jgi:hypothetical protein
MRHWAAISCHQIPAFHVGRDWHFYIEMIDAWRLAQGKLGG